MIRYIALAWNPLLSTTSARAAALKQQVARRLDGWTAHHVADGLSVFTLRSTRPGTEVHRIEKERGIVLGTLFRRSSDVQPQEAVVALTEREMREIHRSSGRTLVEGFWGRYVAILRDHPTSDLKIVRAPLGTLACYVTEIDGVQILFSRPQDGLKLHDGPLSINWSYVAAAASAVGANPNETGLNEIAQVIAGECLRVLPSGSRSREPYWRVESHAAVDSIADTRLAAQLIRKTTTACVSSWASLYSSLLHRLSGGLDSSIVLGCLKEAPSKPQVTCLTYYGAYSGGEDERELARLAAESARSQLVEIHHDTTYSDLPAVLELPKGASPSSVVGALSHCRSEIDIARKIAAGAVFSGIGGDWIFYTGPLEDTAADVLRTSWSVPRFLSTAMHVARTERRTLWSVVRSAGQLALQPSSSLDQPDFSMHSRLVPREIIAELRRQKSAEHEEEVCQEMFSPGKRRQLAALRCTPLLASPFGGLDDPDYVTPLISQPLVELVARIPIYVLASRGLDRSAARDAFAGVVPDSILKRTAKGMISSSSLQLFSHYRGFLKDLLFDGLMMRKGLLDAQKVERLFNVPKPNILLVDEVLSEHLSVETWLRAWSRDGRCRDLKGDAVIAAA